MLSVFEGVGPLNEIRERSRIGPLASRDLRDERGRATLARQHSQQISFDMKTHVKTHEDVDLASKEQLMASWLSIVRVSYPSHPFKAFPP